MIFNSLQVSIIAFWIIQTKLKPFIVYPNSKNIKGKNISNYYFNNMKLYSITNIIREIAFKTNIVSNSSI